MYRSPNAVPLRPTGPATLATSLKDWEEFQLRHAKSFGDDYRAGNSDTYQEWSFRNVKRERRLMIDAAKASYLPDKQIIKMENCRNSLYVYRNDRTGVYRHTNNACHSRWCPRCAQAAGHSVSADIMANLPPAKGKLMFLTLTQLKIAGEPIETSIRRLRRAFELFRRSPLWLSTVTAGTYVMEFTLDANQSFHTHVHAIIDTKFADYQDYSKAWSKACGYDAILDISPVRDPEAQLKYLTKYISKPISASFYDHPDLLPRIINALRGAHMFHLLGAWHGLALRKKALADRKTASSCVTSDTWTFVGCADRLISLAHRGDVRAAEYLFQLGFGSYVRSRPSLFDPSPDPQYVHDPPSPGPLFQKELQCA